MICGYPDHPSVLPGETLRLHIASDRPVSFRAYFFRHAMAPVYKGRTEVMLAYERSFGPPDREWDWPVYEYQIPSDWPSGAYIALFVGVDDEDTFDPANPQQREAGALFAVKSRCGAGRILYKLPIFTYHAYNELGVPNGSLYTGGYRKLTLHRPGGGVGGRPWDHYFPDVYDPSSPRQTFWHWDAPFISWLEQKRFVVDFCTDLDVHENVESFLNSYQLLLSVGHDE